MSANEKIQLVDHWNRPIGACERHMMRKHGLLHRATYVLVRNSQQHFCVQLRSQSKDYCPGFWDIAAGGVVAENESYHDGAVRELFEELAVSAPLHFLTEFYTQGDDGGRAFGQLFITQWDGAIQAQAEEIDAVEWLSIEQIECRATQMTADSLLALRLFQLQQSPQPFDQPSTFHGLQRPWAIGDRLVLGFARAPYSSTCAGVFANHQIPAAVAEEVYEIVDCLHTKGHAVQYIVRSSTQQCELISSYTLNAWCQEGASLKPFAIKLSTDVLR